VRSRSWPPVRLAASARCCRRGDFMSGPPSCSGAWSALGVRSAPRDVRRRPSPQLVFGPPRFGLSRGDSLVVVVRCSVALAATGGDVRTAMWWAVVPAVLSVLLVLLVREPWRSAPPHRGPCARDDAPVPAAALVLARRHQFSWRSL